jgi:hypothetical protein
LNNAKADVRFVEERIPLLRKQVEALQGWCGV